MDRCEHTERPVAARCVCCGKRLCHACRVFSGGRNWCADCVPRKGTAIRSPNFSTMLSLLPGLGQVYAGAPLKGLLFFAGGVALAAGHAVLPAAVFPAFWALAAWDARMTALKRNERATGGRAGITGPGDGDRLLLLGTALIAVLYTVMPPAGGTGLNPLSIWAAFAVVIFLSLVMGRGGRSHVPKHGQS